MPKAPTRSVPVIAKTEEIVPTHKTLQLKLLHTAKHSSPISPRRSLHCVQLNPLHMQLLFQVALMQSIQLASRQREEREEKQREREREREGERRESHRPCSCVYVCEESREKMHDHSAETNNTAFILITHEMRSCVACVCVCVCAFKRD